MRTFEHFPKDKQCPVCGTNKDRETVLVPIYGTQEGSISQAVCVHADCIINRRQSIDNIEQPAYIGIIDDLGLESIIEVDKEKFANTLLRLQQRARFNSQRNPQVYFAKMPKGLAAEIRKSTDYVKAGNVVKGLSNYKQIGF